MIPEQWAQLCRDRKCDQKILRWHQLGLLPFNPLFALVVLTMGTTMMTTGMGDFDCVFATAALQNHHVAALAATAPHGLQGLAVTGEQLRAMQTLQLILVAFHHL
jgi:hypothetical protein